MAKEYFKEGDRQHKNLLPLNLQLHADQGLKENLDLSYYKLGDKYITAFSKAIRYNYRLKSLNLKDNRISEESASLLVQNIPENL